MVQLRVQSLVDLFSAQTVTNLPADMSLFRAVWTEQPSFPSGHWFALTCAEAAHYVFFRFEDGARNRWRPAIFEGATRRDLKILSLARNRVNVFEKTHGGLWTQQGLADDIREALETIDATLDGFFRPDTKEVFLRAPHLVLREKAALLDADALDEASRVKGFDVRELANMARA